MKNSANEVRQLTFHGTALYDMTPSKDESTDQVIQCNSVNDATF